MTHTIRRLSPSILLSFPCLSIFVAAYLELNIIGIGINECHCKGIAALGFDVLSVGGWSTAGCSLRGVVDDTIVCECNHMTNFAALVVSNLQRSNPAFSQFRYIFAIHTNYNVMLSNKYGRYRLRHIIRKKQETHVWKFTRTPQYVTKASEKPLFLLVWIPPHTLPRFNLPALRRGWVKFCSTECSFNCKPKESPYFMSSVFDCYLLGTFDARII